MKTEPKRTRQQPPPCGQVVDLELRELREVLRAHELHAAVHEQRLQDEEREGQELEEVRFHALAHGAEQPQ